MIKKAVISSIALLSVLMCCCASEKASLKCGGLSNACGDGSKQCLDFKHPDGSTNTIIPTPPQQVSYSTGAIISVEPVEEIKTIIHNNCPKENMVEVNGDYCYYLEQKCLEWRDTEHKVCLRYQEGYANCFNDLKKHMHFCVDKYEIPNIEGQKPQLGMSYYDVENFCKSQGKRIGTDQEWTLAAEGNERSPYPHSWERKENWCNWDKPHFDVDERKLFGIGPIRDEEMKRLDQSAASGNYENCYTEWGGDKLYDMQANADEWTKNISLGGKPYIGLLKGGYWAKGLVRNRARPETTGHGPSFNGYEVGGRCFADIK